MKPNTSTLFLCLALFSGVLSLAANPADTPLQPASGATGTPRIKFDQTVYDFGKTCKVEQVTGKFTFANVGHGVLKLDKPVTSCGCTVAAAKPEVLQPGEKGEIAFSLHLGRSRVVMQKQITVVCNDPQSPKTVLTIKAEYIPLFEAIPVSINVNLQKGQSTNLTTRITRTDGEPLRITKLAPSQPWIRAQVEPEANSSNRTVRIITTLNPAGNPGYYSESVQAYVEGSDQPAFSLPYHGRLIGDVTVTPQSLYWAVVDPQKALAPRRIVVQSAASAPALEIKAASCSLPEISLETSVRSDGKSGEILAKLNSAPGHTTNGVIRFETNVPSQPVVEIPLVVNVVKPRK